MRLIFSRMIILIIHELEPHKEKQFNKYQHWFKDKITLQR